MFNFINPFSLIIVILLLTLSLSVSTVAADIEIYHIPLIKYNSLNNIIRGSLFPININKKSTYDYTIIGNQYILLNEYANTEYYAVITIGSGPSQEFKMLIDNTINNLWIISSKSINNNHNNKYNSDLSKTYQINNTKFNIDYIINKGGELNGFLSTDNIYSGTQYNNKLLSNNELFIEILVTSGIGKSFDLCPYDGIVGLGYQSLLPAGNNNNENSLLKHLLGQSLYSVYISDNEAKIQSEIILGGIDNKYYNNNEPIQYFPLMSDYSNWELNLTSITINSRSITKSKKIRFDISTSVIAGPADEIIELARILGASPTYQNPFEYVIQCQYISSLPTIIFTLNGTNFALSPEDYVVNENNNAICIFGFTPIYFPDNMETFWILGNSFNREYYTIYDIQNSRIGLTRAIRAGIDKPILPTECAPGQYTQSIDQCIDCSPGTYQSLPGQSECIQCPIDYYQSYSGQSGCIQCPNGWFTNEPGSVNCIEG